MTKSVQEDVCPSREALFAALEEPDASATLLAHLNACERCQKLVERELIGDEVAGELRSALISANPPGLDLPPGYEILQEVRRGGQGVVYEAYHAATCRRVALKALLSGAWSTRSERRRFRREIRLASALRHPNIVAIYDAGETPGGVPYCAMEFVDGLHVDRYCDGLEDSGPLRVRLLVFQKIAEAVSYANRRGILHRDLKPSNVLVDSRGEPFVLDFGLARDVGPPADDLSADPESGELTRGGAFVGTTAWASPEQLRGDRDLDERTDVYALGLILYRMVTGQPPPPEDRSSVGSAGSGRVPHAPPSRYVATARAGGDLDRVVAKACAVDRRDRYASTGALAADVGRLLRGEPVLAHPPGLALRAARWIQTHPLAVVVMMALLLAWPAARLVREVRAAGVGRDIVAGALEQLAAGEHGQAEQTLFTEFLDPTTNALALRRLRESFESGEVSARRWALRELCLEQRCVAAVELDSACYLDWSPDGETIAVSSADGIVLLSVPELEVVHELTGPEGTGRRPHVRYHPRGTHLYASYSVVSPPRSGSINRVWDVRSEPTPSRSDFESFASPSPYGAGLVFVNPSREVAVTHLDADAEETLPVELVSRVETVLASPSGAFMLLGGGELVHCFRKTANEEWQPVWRSPEFDLTSLGGFSADETQVAVGLHVIRIDGPGPEILEFREPVGRRNPGCYPGPTSGEWFGVRNQDSSILLYARESETAPYRIEGRLSGIEYQVQRLGYSADAGLLASTEDPGTVRLWKPYGDPPGIVGLGDHSSAQNQVHDARVDRDGVITADGSLGSLSLSDRGGASIRQVPVPGNLITGVDRYRGESTWIACADRAGEFLLVAEGEDPAVLPRNPEANAGGANLVRFRPDGRELAGVDQEGWLHVWAPPFLERPATSFDLSDGRTKERLGAVAWSPDGLVLAVSGGEGALYWRTASGIHATDSSKHLAQTVTDLAFHPNGQLCISVDKSGRIGWWTPLNRVPDRVELFTKGSTPMEFLSVAISKDGDVLFAGNSVGDVLALDSETGRLLANFQVAEGKHVMRLIPDPERDRLLVVGGLRTIVWLDFERLDRILARRTLYWVGRMRGEGSEPALADEARAWAEGLLP